MYLHIYLLLSIRPFLCFPEHTVNTNLNLSHGEVIRCRFEIFHTSKFSHGIYLSETPEFDFFSFHFFPRWQWELCPIPTIWCTWMQSTLFVCIIIFIFKIWKIPHPCTHYLASADCAMYIVNGVCNTKTTGFSCQEKERIPFNSLIVILAADDAGVLMPAYSIYSPSDSLRNQSNHIYYATSYDLNPDYEEKKTFNHSDAFFAYNFFSSSHRRYTLAAVCLYNILTCSSLCKNNALQPD